LLLISLPRPPLHARSLPCPGWHSKISSGVKKLLKKMLLTNLAKRLHNVTALEQDTVFDGISWDAVRSKQLTPPFVPSVRGAGDSHYFSADQDTMSKNERQAKKGEADVDQSVFNEF
jgi:hypothetical protein